MWLETFEGQAPQGLGAGSEAMQSGLPWQLLEVSPLDADGFARVRKARGQSAERGGEGREEERR